MNVLIAIGLALDMTENSRAYDWHASKKEKITRQFGLKDPKVDGYHDPRAFSAWLADMKCYFGCYEMSDMHKIRFVRMKLVGPVRIYWTSIEIARARQCKNL